MEVYLLVTKRTKTTKHRCQSHCWY